MSSTFNAEFAAFNDFHVEEQKEIIITSNSYTVNTDFIKTEIDEIFNINIEDIKDIPDDMLIYVIDKIHSTYSGSSTPRAN